MRATCCFESERSFQAAGRTSIRIAVAVFLAVLPFAGAHAQETPFPDMDHRGKPTMLHGQGSSSCGDFLKNREPYLLQNSIHSQEMAWLLGYLHGMDMYNPYDTRPYDYNGLDAWVAEFCRTHPLDQLVNAGLQFYKYIGGRAPMHTDYSLWQHYPR